MLERCKILCKNKNCLYWSGVEKEYFKLTKIYVPFIDDFYTGICTKPTVKFIPIWRENKNYLFKFVTCGEGKFVPNSQEPTIECADTACMWCIAGFCARKDGIAVDTIKFGSENDSSLSCRAQANKKIKGHLDFSRFICKEGSKLPDPPGYADNFWEKKRDKIKELKKSGVSEEYLNQVYGYEVDL